MIPAQTRILAACGKCSAQYDVSGQKRGDTLRCRCGGQIVVPEVRAAEARLVRCPSCGAVRGSGGLNCEFCGARFSTVDKGWGSMCPKCFCRLPNDAQFCVECGLKISPHTLDVVRSDLLCPRCKCALQGRIVETMDLAECATCGGLWVSAATFQAVCQTAEARSAALAFAGVASPKRGHSELTPEDQVRYIPCPICKRLMNRRNFASVSGVIIDMCRDDGVWFDNQELARIVQFIEAGGMEKAWAAEARQREHSEKMKPKAGAAAYDFGPMAQADADLLRPSYGRSESVVASVLSQVLAEVAKAFFR